MTAKQKQQISKAAGIIGAIGGSRNTPAQQAARARNALLGGRPAKKKPTPEHEKKVCSTE